MYARYGIRALLTGLLAAALLQGLGAPGYALTVRIDPAALEVPVAGASFSVNVVVENVSDLGAFQLNLVYNPGLVIVENASQAVLGSFLESTGRTAVKLGPTIDNIHGTMALGAATFGEQVGPNGSGTMASVTLKVQSPQSGGLALADVVLLNTAAQTIPVDTVAGADLHYTPNQKPTANAGQDQTVTPGQVVTLDGSGSTDPDNNLYAYSWAQIMGPAVSLANASAPQATFIAPSAGIQDTVLEFRLTVADLGGLTDTDTVRVTVPGVQNQPPTAAAGPDKTVNQGDVVVLDGSGSSDPDNNITSYLWVQTDGPAVQLTNAALAQASFVAPAVGPGGATLSFLLTVRDSAGLEAADSVTVVVLETGGGEPAEMIDGVYKDGPPTSINAYVQTYTVGSVLVILTPDSKTEWYVFLDPDVSDGIHDHPDLAQEGHRLTMSFSSGGQAQATLVYATGGSKSWDLGRVFQAVEEPAVYDGIYKNSPITINLFLQSYTTGSAVLIFTPDLAHWLVFLDPAVADGISMNTDLGGAPNQLTMTPQGAGSYAATISYAGGSVGTYMLDRIFDAPHIGSEP